ncbi:MAG: insulinase family protein [Dehalococcoidia bacterium]|nr:MAG: insulinase family protein [Dehalococcoidia bacterium]
MYQKMVLDNGLRIVSSAMPHTRSVCICIFIGTGSRYEMAEQAGLSHFVEHLCFKGTERRPTAKELSETIDGVGGILNGGTDKELTVYWAKVARTHFLLALDLLGDMLRNSKFDPVDMENERKVIVEELNMCMDSPQSRVDMLIDEVIWPAQPLGRDVAGSKETVAAIDHNMLLGYLSTHYLPSNTVVGVAGDISHNEVVDAVMSVLGDWPDGVPGSWFPADNGQDASRLVVEPRKMEQAHLCLAVRGISHIHPDRFILDLLNLILGEGMSSRLFLEIRERRGLAYEIHSHVSHFHDSGSVNICAGVDPKRVDDAIEAILMELAKLREDQVSEAEIVKAKEMGKGRLMLRMEDTRNVTGWIGGQELLMGHIRTVDEVTSILDAVTASDLQRVARELFVTNRLCLALVGPSRKERRLERLLKL